jgi:integrase
MPARAESPSDESTVGEYLEQWLAHAKGRVRATTYEGYESLVRLHAAPALGEIPLRSLHPLDVQRLYADLLGTPRVGGRVLSSSTVRNLHRVLVVAFRCAVRWGIMQSNPVTAAQGPRPRRPELAVIDRSLAARILQTARGTAVELPCAVALATGMRRGEILALRWRDMDQGYATAQVTRTLQVSRGSLSFEPPTTPRSRRAVILPAFLRPYLARQREDQAGRRNAAPGHWNDLDLVVDSGDGSPVNPDTLSSGWVRFLRANGLPPVRFHDLRHAHATFMLLKGIHPKVVSERLGHSSVGITLDTYSHVLPSMQTEAARAIDELFGAS